METPRRLAHLAAAAALSLCAAIATAQPAPAAPAAAAKASSVRSMLWVGNSFFYYNNSMHGHVGQLLSAAGVTGTRSVLGHDQRVGTELARRGRAFQARRRCELLLRR